MSTVAMITGAGGQDGLLLAEALLAEGAHVHAIVRRPESRAELESICGEVGCGTLSTHVADLLDLDTLTGLTAQFKPDEFYNLGGQSSVSASFNDPWTSWRTNADPLAALLECVRQRSPHTRVYQASSSEMFGFVPGGDAVHDEESPLNPRSPYASAKAAAHLLCRCYRNAWGLRVCCGILFNHESRRRGKGFLTSKVVEHVRALSAQGAGAAGRAEPLKVGNLKIERDWGFAPDYIRGVIAITRQITTRSAHKRTAAEADEGANYRDYVLGTGVVNPVWKLIDRAFALAGFGLRWELGSTDPAKWRADFADSGRPAVVVDREFLRPTDPQVIRADPSRANNELGWKARADLDLFLRDMLGPAASASPPRREAAVREMRG